MRLKLTLAYEGTAYSGWQIQIAGGKSLPTIQGKVEEAFRRISGHRVTVHGAGRTDAGVHAEGQVCHADIDENLTRIDWKRALNACLPQDIRILESVAAACGFHARKDARAKRYAYSLWMHKDRPLPRIRNFTAHCPPLDLEGLAAALPFLIGRRDFASFRNGGDETSDTVREIHSIDCLPGYVAGLRCPDDWPVLTLVFTGSGFLRQMARNLSGLLVYTGLGKISPERIPGIIDAGDRRAMPGPCAPAQGLSLLEVIYPEPCFSPQPAPPAV